MLLSDWAEMATHFPLPVADPLLMDRPRTRTKPHPGICPVQPNVTWAGLHLFSALPRTVEDLKNDSVCCEYVMDVARSLKALEEWRRYSRMQRRRGEAAAAALLQKIARGFLGRRQVLGGGGRSEEGGGIV